MLLTPSRHNNRNYLARTSDLILRGFAQLIPFCTSNIAGLIVNILNSYIQTIANNGIKVTSENIVDIQKLQSGRTVWLETGNLNAGLKHIVNIAGLIVNILNSYIQTIAHLGNKV
jgi:hypothetical protein